MTSSTDIHLLGKIITELLTTYTLEEVIGMINEIAMINK